MTYIAEITIMPLKELLDPQGKAVHQGLNKLGLKQVSEVRIGKHIQLKMEAESKEQAQYMADEACKKLLANPVMEYFECLVHE